ncbi:MAG: prephenate dehydrogenase [Candidatus Aenigmarchaeota archaeon]|nr:prephenate dehydrogenase [Candidatus Aenigmarchaeota archaeon]
MGYTIAVSGAAGRIGKIYVPKLLAQGHVVRAYDVNRMKLEQLYKGTGAVLCTNNRQLVEGADAVLLFVPVPKVPEVLKEMNPSRPSKAGGIPNYLRPDVVIGSAASSKEGVANQEQWHIAQERYPHARIVDFHPMHGEQTGTSDFPKGQNILTVPVRDFPYRGKTGEALLHELFLPMGANVKHVGSAVQHDEILSDPQGGNHCIAFSRDTAWHLAGTDPDMNDVYADPLGDAKSLHSRRPLALNLEVYPVTMQHNRFVKSYIQQYEEVLAEIYRMIIEGEREALYKMFDEAREHIGHDAIRDARDRLEVSYGRNLYGTSNSHISDLAWGELYKRRNKRPADFLEFESPHYAIGRAILCAALGGDTRRFVDNAIDVPETRWQDYNYGRAVAVINQIVQSGDEAALLNHLQRLKRFFSSSGMKRDLGKIAEDSTELSRKLRESAYS